MKDGERNGKGKEYYFKKRGIEFEGEYKNGKRWNEIGYNDKGQISREIKEGNGMIKEYFKDGNIDFEGEYKNGERNGKGKQYKENFKTVRHSLFYDGEFLNGKRNGQGKLYYEGPRSYEEDFFNDEFINGKVKEHSLGGNGFNGEYLNGKKWKGTIIRTHSSNRKIWFEGEYKDGIMWNAQR